MEENMSENFDELGELGDKIKKQFLLKITAR